MPRHLLATGDRLRREWWLWGWQDGKQGLPPQQWPGGLGAGLAAAYRDGYQAGLAERDGGG